VNTLFTLSQGGTQDEYHLPLEAGNDLHHDLF